MKKYVLSFLIFLSVFPTLSAQLMKKSGLQNTLWSGGGNNNTEYKNEWDGFLDTFQARLSASVLTVDAMIQWAAATVYTDNGDIDYLSFRNPDSEVNFILKTIKNLDLGTGTKLNWAIGPAPETDLNIWEIENHIRQGGLSYGIPGSAPITGATYYANHITESPETTSSLAARYTVPDLIQFAVGIPDGSTTDDFIANAGMRFTPTEKVSLSAACNGLLKGDCNLYAGSAITITDQLSFDVWFAADNLGGRNNNKQTGIGTAFTIITPNMTLRPEIGFTFYENSDYTTAGYTGIHIQYEITETLTLSLWTSIAQGSENKTWDESDATKKWHGGTLLDLRPTITYYINSSDALAAVPEVRKATTYQDKTYNYWLLGFYWKHVF